MSQKDNPQKVTNKGLLIGVSYKVFLCVTDNVFHSHDRELSLLRNDHPDTDIHISGCFLFEWEVIIVPRQLE